MSVRKKKLYKKISKDIEKLYASFGNYPQSIPNEVGLKQFAEFEHSKIYPIDPDLYFLHLKTGKVWYNLQVEMYRKMYQTNDWPGWYQIKEDYKDELWIIKHLFSWVKYPEWLDGKEEEETTRKTLV
jgi:hypothetical protein